MCAQTNADNDNHRKATQCKSMQPTCQELSGRRGQGDQRLQRWACRCQGLKPTIGDEQKPSRWWMVDDRQSSNPRANKELEGSKPCGRSLRMFQGLEKHRNTSSSLPLAITMRSGLQSQLLMENHSPVRPNPACTCEKPLSAEQRQVVNTCFVCQLDSLASG